MTERQNTPSDHFESGQLSEAIEALNAEIKAKPADVAKRNFLAELLCFAGNVERADRMLDIIGDQDPAAAVGIALFRQLLRGELARQEFFSQGRVPELLDGAPAHVELLLRASVAVRDGNLAEAGRLATEAEQARPQVYGTMDGKPFDDMRDVDDLVAGVFEVVTSTGKYYWIPIERVNLVEFRKPERTRDLYWRRALMDVEQGPDGEVYLPVTYSAVGHDVDDRTRLGRVTDWVGEDGEPVRGLGQRTYLVGEDAVPILQIETIRFGAQG